VVNFMRPRILLTILFAVTLFVAGFALINSMRKGDAAVPQTHVLAATGALPAGTLLRNQDIEWRAVTEARPDQIVRPSDIAVQAKPEIIQETEARVYGAALRHAVAAGEPIRRGDIVKPGERDFLKLVLPPGARAIAIPLTTGGASTGILSPGDRVDVVLTQNFKQEGQGSFDSRTPLTRRSVSETIVENLRVLAIDAPPDPKTAGVGNNGGFGRTVTLEVTPDQVEKINVATELGKLTVALRSTQVAESNLVNFAEPTAIKPQWAGDVSPALLGAAQEKPIALAPRPIMVLRGTAQAHAGEQIRRELVKP
jgi:pilus assembly protein CpaB